MESGKLLEVKDVFYELLEEQPSDAEVVKADQQMSLSMSNAIREKGTVIIQNQNVVFQKHIVHIAVKGMRLIDNLLMEGPLHPTELQLPVAVEQPAIKPADIIMLDESEPVDELPKNDPIEACCKHMFKQEVGWKDFTSQMQTAYLTYVLSHTSDKKEAAKCLLIQLPSLKVLETRLCR